MMMIMMMMMMNLLISSFYYYQLCVMNKNLLSLLMKSNWNYFLMAFLDNRVSCVCVRLKTLIIVLIGLVIVVVYWVVLLM